MDELYNHHCCLVSSAETPIDELFQGTAEGTLFDLERYVIIYKQTKPKSALNTPKCNLMCCYYLETYSFQFETETEDSRLRRDVLSEGSISAAGSPSSIVKMLSGEEEMFAFARAVRIVSHFLIRFSSKRKWF